MQNYYNSITGAKRIAFVDNITDKQAKELSAKYPYAVMFASKPESNTDTNLPCIWYNKRRYGILNVNKNVISLGDFSIGLQLTSDNIIELYVATNIDEIKIKKVQVYRNGDYLDVDLNNLLNSYEIISLYNKFRIYYSFWKDNVEITEFSKNIQISNDYIYVTDYNNTNKYIDCDIIKSTSLLSNNLINIESKTDLNGIQIKNSTNFNLKLLPQSAIWKYNNNQIENITIDNGETKKIKILFDEKYDTNLPLNALTFDIKNGDEYIFSNLTASALLSGIDIKYERFENNNSVKLDLYAKYMGDVNQISSLNVILNNKFTNDVWFIGYLSSATSVLDKGIITSKDIKEINNRYLSNTLFDYWHVCDKNVDNFNEKFLDYPNNLALDRNIILILPKDYYPALPLKDGDTDKYIQDPTFILGHDPNFEFYYIINGKQYRLWVISPNVSDDELNFISVITD